jgi:hypothetical protein
MSKARQIACGAVLAAVLFTLLTAVALAATKTATPPSHSALAAGRWSFAFALIGLVVLLPAALALIGVVLWAVTLGEVPISTGGLGSVLKGAVIGADNRVSTSKVVAVTWTYAVASALLSLVIAKWWGHDEGYNAQQAIGLQAEYALLVGGPLGAAILAKGIVTQQQQAGDSGKRAGSPEASQLVSGDNGETDFGDLQYVIFNAVALTFFFGQFFHRPTDGLPNIPDVLLGLTSVSAVGYVSKKAIKSLAPTITKVEPPSGSPGDTVTIWGTGLFDVDNPLTTKPKVTFRSTKAHSHSVSAEVGTPGSEADGLYLPVVVPPHGVHSGTHKVAVRTVEGRFAQWAKNFTVKSR